MQDIIAQAEHAMNERNWPEAIKRWQKVFITLKEQTPAEAYVLLSMAHRFRGNPKTAEKIIKQGIAKHPENISILAEHVELARVKKDRSEEVSRLQHLNQRIQEQEQDSNSSQIPLDSLEELHRQAMYAIRLGKVSNVRKHDDQATFQALEDIIQLEAMTNHENSRINHVSGIWVCNVYKPWKSLAIRGQIFQAIDNVTLMYNDKVLSSTTVVNGHFNFFLNNALNGLDPASKLTVACQYGIVPFYGMHDYWKPEPPFVRNDRHYLDVEGALMAGYKLAKKGDFRPKYLPPEEKQAYYKTYIRLHDFFKDFLDYPVLISHGTLLGLYRDGDIIPHDDDFDCFYLSSKDNVCDVARERFEILKKLYEQGIHINVSHTGHIKVDIHGVVIDLMPAWIEDGMLHIAGYTSMPIKENMFEPYTSLDFAGGHLWTFADPEIFLVHQYGPEWRTPDPSYFYKLSAKNFDNQQKLRPDNEEMRLCLKSTKEKYGRS